MFKDFKDWGMHWYAFQKTAFKFNVWHPRMLFHDCYKPWLEIIFNHEVVHKLHRKWSRHHVENPTGKKSYDLYSMIIDWECARFTKPDKQLNARDTLDKYYPEMRKLLYPILEELNL